MSTIATAPLAVEDYLHDPAYEHFEYADGRAIEINVETKKHSRIQQQIAALLSAYLFLNPIGYAATELRCLLSTDGQTRFRLPDNCVVLNDPFPDSDYLEGSPDFVVEVKSPEDSVVGLFRKMDEYLAAGTKLAWLVIPEEKSVFVFTSGQTTRTAVPGETLDGANVLPGLIVPVNNIFPS